MFKERNKYARFFSKFLFGLSCLIIILNLEPTTLQVKADSVSVNLAGTGVQVGGPYEGGFGNAASGYLVYIVDDAGNPISPDSKFVATGSYSILGVGQSDFSSRLGGYSSPTYTALTNAPWGNPINAPGFSSNSQAIYDWFSTQDTDGVLNASKLIANLWSAELEATWVSSDYNLIVETCYSVKGWYKGDVTTISPYGTLVTFENLDVLRVAPYISGTSANLPTLFNTYLNSTKPSVFTANGQTYFVKPIHGYMKSVMVSGYAKGIQFCEMLASPLAGLSAGESSPRYLLPSEVSAGGYGMLSVKASGINGGGTSGSVDPLPTDFDGYRYMLFTGGDCDARVKIG